MSNDIGMRCARVALVALAALGLGVAPVAAAPAILQEIGSLELPEGLTSLNGPNSIAMSGDGLFAYVTAQDGDALHVLAWDAGLEAFTPVQTVEDGAEVPFGLDLPQDVVVSPDDLHVYVASRNDDTISIFARDAGTGQVTYLANANLGLDGMNALAISPDGAHVYATGVFADALRTYARDAVTGALTGIDLLEDQTVGGGGAFFVLGLDGPSDVTVSPDGASVYVASDASNAVAAFSRDPGTGLLFFEEAEFDGFAGQNGLGGALSVLVSPDGAHVYVGSATDAAVTLLARDALTSELTWVEAVFDNVAGVNGISGPADLAISADGAHLYVAAASDDALTLFTRDALTGSLTFVERLLDGVGGVDGLNGARGLVLHPGEAHVTTVGLVDDAISTFARDGGTGQVTFLDTIAGGTFELTNPSHLQISPDGAHLYLSTFSNGLATLVRDPGTGLLTLGSARFEGVDGVVGLDSPRRIAISPDGAHLYVAATSSDSVAVFGRDAGSGDLTFVEAQFDGVGGVDGLEFADDVAVSPNGAHVYVLGEGIVIFARDAGTGALTFLDELRGIAAGGTIANLHSPIGFAMSADGAHVYVLSSASPGDAVIVFGRDAGSGALTVVQELFDGDLPGLEFPRQLGISPDGATVYVATSASDRARFHSLARDPATGLLTLVDTEEDERDGVTGINAVHQIVVAPDGQRLYAGDGLLVSFVRRPSGELGFSHETVGGSSPRIAVGPGAAHVYAAGSDEVVRTYMDAETCPPAPLAGCRVAGAASSGKLKIQQKGGKSGLKWTWKASGEPTLKDDFGEPDRLEPNRATHYALCGYDESGAPALAFRALVPANDFAWRESNTSFRLKNRSQSPEGIDGLILKGAVAGKALIKVKGKGDLLTIPPIPLAAPFRLQLRSFGAGPMACWEATFSPGGLAKNNDRIVIALPD